MHIAFIFGEGKDQARTIKVRQTTFLVRFDQHLLRRVLRLFDRRDVADAKVHRQRHQRLGRNRGAACPVSDITITGAIDYLPRRDSGQSILVGDHDRSDASLIDFDITRSTVIQHLQCVAMLQNQIIRQDFELFDVWYPHTAPVLGDQIGSQVIDMLGTSLATPSLVSSSSAMPLTTNRPEGLSINPSK